MRFADPAFLALLALIPLLHRFWKRRGESVRIPFSVPFPSSVRKSDPEAVLRAIRYLGMTALIVALARPQTSYQQSEKWVSGIDIVLVMDVSASMNVEDMGERPRLEIAKETMRKFVKGRDNDRIGFVIFSGEPLTLVPPTLDYGLLGSSIGEVETGVLRDGTAIGDGLSMAVARLRNSRAKSRIVILLTDGDNNVGQVDPATAGELAAGFGIKVYTVLIGREGRVKLPIRRKGLFGREVVTYQWLENALNPELLEHIAKITSGKFYRVTEESTLNSVFKEIDQLEKTEIKSEQKTRYDDRFAIPLILGAFLIVLEWLLRSFVWRWFP